MKKMMPKPARNHCVRQFVAAVVIFFSTIAIAAEHSWPPPGVMVDLGTHSLHIQCSGNGTPTVILDAGLGENSLSWIKVEPEIARFTRVCAYDRAGYGWSESGPLPRTSDVIADELSQLLKNGSESGPYVVVGHSLGGLTARTFASRYPALVAGLVLVDATHEKQFERFKQANIRTPIAPSNGFFFVRNSGSISQGLPIEAQELARYLARRAKARLTMYSELRNLRLSTTLAARQNRLPDVPMVVVAHNSIARATSQKAKHKAKVWMSMQRDLATRTSISRFVLADNSGHNVQLDRPEVVVNAIKQVVDGARSTKATVSLKSGTILVDQRNIELPQDGGNLVGVAIDNNL